MLRNRDDLEQDQPLLCQLFLELSCGVFFGASAADLGCFKEELKRVVALGLVFDGTIGVGRKDQSQQDGEGKKDLFHAANMRKAVGLFNNNRVRRRLSATLLDYIRTILPVLQGKPQFYPEPSASCLGTSRYLQEECKMTYQGFIGMILSTGVIVAGFNVAPARAGDDDVAKVVVGGAALVILGAPIISAQDDDDDDYYYYVTTKQSHS